MTVVVDAQIHIWRESSAERPWPEWGASHPQRHRPGRPLETPEVLAAMDAAGVDRAVLVPPSYEGDWNDYVLEAAQAYPERFGAMGRVDVTDRANVERVARWRDEPGMLGIRLTFVRPDHQRWVRDGTADWLWRAAERAGVPLMVFAPALTRELGEVARAHPDLRITLDHLNLSSDTYDVDLRPLLEPVLALAELPNVAVKASALPCFTSDAYPFPSLHEPLRAVFAAYGPKRVFWGSDLSRLTCPYPDLVRLFAEGLPFLSTADRRWALGQGLVDWLRWPGAGDPQTAAPEASA